MPKGAAGPIARSQRNVFINVPFDRAYSDLFLALVVALVRLGRVPHCALEVPEVGNGRLHRILDLIKACPVSFHDVSRVHGRHNMPFELGLACAAKHLGRAEHHYFVLESVPYRIQRTLSDLNGTDAHVHENKVDLVLNAVVSCLSSGTDDPSVADLRNLFDAAKQGLKAIKRAQLSDTVFSRPVFQNLVALASELSRPAARPRGRRG